MKNRLILSSLTILCCVLFGSVNMSMAGGYSWKANKMRHEGDLSYSREQRIVIVSQNLADARIGLPPFSYERRTIKISFDEKGILDVKITRPEQNPIHNLETRDSKDPDNDENGFVKETHEKTSVVLTEDREKKRAYSEAVFKKANEEALTLHQHILNLLK